MKTIERILRNSKYLLFSISLLCSCHASTGKDSSLAGKLDSNIVTQKNSYSPSNNRKSHKDTVFISDMKFRPVVINVRTGDTIVWVNKDLVVHNVTGLSGNGWASPPIRSGATWKMAVLQSADYNCSIHPEMKGEIVVK